MKWRLFSILLSLIFSSPALGFDNGEFCRVKNLFNENHIGYLPVYRDFEYNSAHREEAMRLKPGDVVRCGISNGITKTRIDHFGDEESWRKKHPIIKDEPILYNPKTVFDGVYVDLEDVIVESYKPGQRVYLEGDRGRAFSVFNMPGKNYKNCDGKCERVAWPKVLPTTKLTFIDAVPATFSDPFYSPPPNGKVPNAKDLVKVELFFLVEGSYPVSWGEKQTKTFKGWIRADYIRHDRPETMRPKKEMPVPAVKAPPKPQVRSSQPNPPEKKPEPKPVELEIYTVEPKTNLPFGSSANSFWDIENHWTHSETIEGVPATPEQLYAIDTLARTIYGEMRNCVKNGIRYPMAVAKIVLNRAAYVHHKGISASAPFVKSGEIPNDVQLKGASLEEIIPYVLTSSWQFSAWNDGDPNQSKMLSPKTGSEEWTIILNIAIDSILNMTDFAADTREIEIFHYTSLIRAKNLDEVPKVLKVAGQPIDNKRCMRLWNCDKTGRVCPLF